MLGYRLSLEVMSNKGRIDALIEFKERVVIFELKINQSAQIALDQIKEKGYAEQYKGSGKEIVMIGLNFDTDARNVDEWLIEQGD